MDRQHETAAIEYLFPTWDASVYRTMTTTPVPCRQLNNFMLKSLHTRNANFNLTRNRKHFRLWHFREFRTLLDLCANLVRNTLRKWTICQSQEWTWQMNEKPFQLNSRKNSKDENFLFFLNYEFLIFLNQLIFFLLGNLATFFWEAGNFRWKLEAENYEARRSNNKSGRSSEKRRKRTESK